MSNPAAIIIFGAAIRPDGSASPALLRRVEAALRHGERLTPPPTYLPTGGQGRFGEPECVVMARLLAAAGIPPGRIRQEPTGTDTLSSVRAVVAMLRGHAGPVLAATSRFHLPRCLLLLRLAGRPARPVPISPSTGALRWYWRLRELAALPYDALLMLWHRARDGRA